MYEGEVEGGEERFCDEELGGRQEKGLRVIKAQRKPNERQWAVNGKTHDETLGNGRNTARSSLSKRHQRADDQSMATRITHFHHVTDSSLDLQVLHEDGRNGSSWRAAGQLDKVAFSFPPCATIPPSPSI